MNVNSVHMLKQTTTEQFMESPDENLFAVVAPASPPPVYSSILLVTPEYSPPVTMSQSYEEHSFDSSCMPATSSAVLPAPPSYSSLYDDSSTTVEASSSVDGSNMSNRLGQLDAGQLRRQADWKISSDPGRARVSTIIRPMIGDADQTDGQSATTNTVREKRTVTILYFIFLLLLSVNPFLLILHIILMLIASRLKNNGRLDLARHLRIASYLVGVVGILSGVAFISWTSIRKCERIGHEVNGSCFPSVSQYDNCLTVSCCSADAILYQNSCYSEPDAELSRSCRYVAYWTCYSDRRYYGSCASGRCCRPHETYYVDYCNYNSDAIVASSTRASVDQCQYTVNGTCYVNVYFCYSANGCPSSATYVDGSHNCYYN